MMLDRSPAYKDTGAQPLHTLTGPIPLHTQKPTTVTRSDRYHDRYQHDRDHDRYQERACLVSARKLLREGLGVHIMMLDRSPV